MTLPRAARKHTGNMSTLCFRLLFWVVATSFVGQAALARDTVCQFRAKGLNLNFGVLDPSSNATVVKPVVVATASANMAGDCTGAGSMTVSVAGSSSRQLVSATSGGIIDYTITGLPISLAKPGNATGSASSSVGYTTWLTPNAVQGTILWSAYANAPAATDYKDSITISVNP